ncbi:hypothetical protein CRG98_049323, partial [Punica granatum]
KRNINVKPTSICARWPVEGGVGSSEGKTSASTNPKGGRYRAPLRALGPTSPYLNARLERVLEPTPSEAPVRTRMWTLVGAHIARFWIARLGS